jgi:hypothetical protein
VPGIHLRRAGYFYPIMPDIYTTESRVFIPQHAGFFRCCAGFLPWAYRMSSFQVFDQFDGYL